MRFIIFVLMAVVLILLIICYSLLVMVVEAEKDAEETYRRWKESRNDRETRTDDIQ